MEGFRIDLKKFLGLAKPNQSWFGVIILGQNPQTFMIPIYSTTVLYDILFMLSSVYSAVQQGKQTLMQSLLAYELLVN